MAFANRTRIQRPILEPIKVEDCHDARPRSLPHLRRRTSPKFKHMRLASITPGAAVATGSVSDPTISVFEASQASKDVQPVVEAFKRLSLPADIPLRHDVPGHQHSTPEPSVLSSATPIAEITAIINGIKTSLTLETKTTHANPAPSLARLSPRPASPPHSRLYYRRRSVPCHPIRLAQRRFQRFRRHLWEQGSQLFGVQNGADAFVAPVQLFRTPTSPEHAQESSPDTQTPPFHSTGGTLTVRALIRSESRPPIGLKREFDLATLRATVPEPLQSPRSPDFDREALLSSIDGRHLAEKTSAVGQGQRDQRSTSPPDTAKIVDQAFDPERDSLEPMAIPIHIQYARAHLPALAAIMLSEQVRQGDTIEVAVPRPKAWAETVGFVYTGEEELLTEHVRENILYLGGKI